MHFSRSLAITAAIMASHVVNGFLCESAEKLCFNPPDNQPQNIAVEDIQAVASYLRAYGAETAEGRQFTMTAEGAPGCAEWTLYNNGNVIALAQHFNSTADSSVLYSDIANTIDGGVAASAKQKADSLIGCGTTGGSVGVVYDASNAQYHTAAYLASGYTPAGILIKIVHSD